MHQFILNYPVSDHEEKILEYFGKQNTFNQKKYEGKQTNIFICFTNRCGSTFLASLLASTNYFPKAEECFNWDTIIPTCEQKYFFMFDSYCMDLIKQKQKNNLFISKIGPQQLMMLSKFGQIPNIINQPKFIWIRRKDVVGQSVSLSIAVQNRKWYSTEQGINVIPKYRQDEIFNFIKFIDEANTKFSTYFNIFNANYLEVVYEQLSKNPIKITEEICNFLEIPFQKPDLQKIELEIQRNEINEKFKQRFLNEMKQQFSLEMTNE
jgi:LPS sulfotransferase NodH